MALNDNIPYTSGPVGYDPEQMAECRKCGRQNPPDRPACLYCGTHIQVKDATALRIDTRPFEAWESGFNIIWMGGEVPGVDAVRGAARILGVEEDLLQKLFAGGVSLPLARVRSEVEGDSLKQRLAEAGVGTAVISDKDLN